MLISILVLCLTKKQEHKIINQCLHWAGDVMSIFSVSVKCIKNTPAYFAERLYKAMKVRNPVLLDNHFLYITTLKK